jgi:hypothetical protein
MFTSQADRLKRERMALRPFAPAGNADVRLPHAQEYSAFYLGEIAKHLERLATSAERLDKTLEIILSRMKPDITRGTSHPAEVTHENHDAAREDENCERHCPK